MAKMIADDFQRQAFGQEMTGTGVAQGMGTAMGSVIPRWSKRLRVTW